MEVTHSIFTPISDEDASQSSHQMMSRVFKKAFKKVQILLRQGSTLFSLKTFKLGRFFCFSEQYNSVKKHSGLFLALFSIKKSSSAVIHTHRFSQANVALTKSHY